MHRHQGWNVRHGLCHIYMRYLYIYELFIAFVCFVVCSLLQRDGIFGVLCRKWQARESTGMFGNLMAIYYIMPQFIQNHSSVRYAHENLHDLLKSVHIQCARNPLWECVSLWLSKSFGRYANIENNNDNDGDGDGDGDGDDDPCKNALTAPEPLLASAHSFSNISTILVLKNT